MQHTHRMINERVMCGWKIEQNYYFFGLSFNIFCVSIKCDDNNCDVKVICHLFIRNLLNLRVSIMMVVDEIRESVNHWRNRLDFYSATYWSILRREMCYLWNSFDIVGWSENFFRLKIFTQNLIHCLHFMSQI
jgi:hypothetical protein